MKLLVLLGVAAVASSAPMPQSGSREPRPFPPKLTDDFFKYLGRYQKIFANPANHKSLQDIFGSRSMRRMIISLLHKKPPVDFPKDLRPNYRDNQMSRDEFMAWYPTLVVLFKRFDSSPVIREEWRVADTDDKGFINPIKIWTMLRDATTNKFFTSFLSLLYSEWQKTYRGRRGRRSFFNNFKKDAFEKAFGGLWGRIAKMPQVSNRVIKKMSEEVALSQGPEAAEDFMESMGMGKTSAAEKPDAIPVMTTEGEDSVLIPVESTPGEMTQSQEPFIAANEKVTTTSGQEMTASQMVANDMEPMPATPVTLTMPTGKKVDLIVAPASPDTEEQPMAEITNADGDSVSMPVVKMENNGITATSEVMTDSGSTVKMEMEAPTSADSPFAGATIEKPVKITDTATGASAEAIASPSSNSTLNEELCGEDETCAPFEVSTSNINMTVPFAMEPELASDELGSESTDLTMTVTNEATGVSTTLGQVTAKKEGDKIVIEGTSADGKTKLEMDIVVTETQPAAGGEGALEPEGGEAIVKTADNAEVPLATGEISNVTVSEDTATGEGQKITAEANINGTPTLMTVEGDLDELNLQPNKTIEMSVSVDGGRTEEKLEVVAEDEMTVTGKTETGVEMTVPKPDVVAPADGNPATENNEVKIQSPGMRGEEAVPITKVATDGEDKEIITAQTPQGGEMVIKVDMN